MRSNSRKPREWPKNLRKKKTKSIKSTYLVEDKQSLLESQTVNEVSGRKSTSRAKLKGASKEERLQKWEEHFKNMPGKPLK